MKLFNVALSAALIFAPAALLAQAPQASTPVTGKTIQERKVEQQHRIAQGVQSGQLTAGETARIEHQEAGTHAFRAYGISIKAAMVSTPSQRFFSRRFSFAAC